MSGQDTNTNLFLVTPIVKLVSVLADVTPIKHTIYIGAEARCANYTNLVCGVYWCQQNWCQIHSAVGPILVSGSVGLVSDNWCQDALIGVTNIGVG